MKTASLRFIFSICFIVFGLSACVQMPTEKSGVSDLRPQISFRAADEALMGARINVDGLDVGNVSDYPADVATLRILPGNHRIVVSTPSGILLDEKVYLGDGVIRVFLVK
ncbi:MAG: hypothetical protein LBL72_02715 [Candidatus Accumulibacter sp.]|jgi:hypothetical protein|nr:hypothetical protein [Accumulibacter sp.]